MDEPFIRIAMDIVGPLPRSSSGKRYILDYATHYPEAVALRTIDANDVAEELLALSRVGVPQEILTDQGTNFTSQLISEVYRLLHIKPIRTTPYHPQTERFNGTLKAMLKKTAAEEGRDWDRLLLYLLFAYREVPQASTGFSPFELLYGRNVRGPLDILKESWEASRKSTESVVSYVLMIQERLAKLRDSVQENLKNAQATQKEWYDRHAQNQPGDQVLVLLPTSTNKLLAEWRGLYSIVRKTSDVNYEIKLTDSQRKNLIFHVNMLREWHS
jgi:transposase InsO family protein